MYHSDDTIAAIATAPGGAARGMVRVSGPNVPQVLATCFLPVEPATVESVRYPTVVAGKLLGPTALPCDLFYWPGERSYTREPVAELHTFGAPPLLEAVVQAVCQAGARLAAPGEFTLRAFLAGRLDLTQAEAVLGVIDAGTTEELDAALAQLAGGLARPLSALRDDLLQLLAELEAGLDFVDEDIEFIGVAEIVARLGSAQQLLHDVSAQLQSRDIANRLRRVVLLGRPNAGKSSLFNVILSRQSAYETADARAATEALVSPQRGTTRDYLLARITLGDVDCELVDTAGVEGDEGCRRSAVGFRPEGSDSQTVEPFWGTEIDATAQEAARSRGREADVRIWCVDPTDDPDTRVLPPLDKARDVLVFTKSDLTDGVDFAIDSSSSKAVARVATSSRTGAGIDELFSVIRRLLVAGDASASGRPITVAATAERCRESVRLAVESLARASELAATGCGDELVAAEIRGALDELGQVVGAVYTDDLLDRVFSTFCIGK